jgi:SPFH domain / Band 7 family
MTWIEYLVKFFSNFRLWYTVLPWEQGIRIRGGSRVLLTPPGVHVAIPLLDVVYVQNVRMHVVNTPSQKVALPDGRTVAVITAVGFAVDDMLKVYRAVQHVDEAVYAWTTSAITAAITEAGKFDRVAIEVQARKAVEEKAREWGLRIDLFCVTDFAYARVYGLLQDGKWARESMVLDQGRR